MSFLKQFWDILQGLLNNSIEPTPRKEVSPEEGVTRYLFQNSHFNKSGRVKPGAYLPNHKLKTSLFRVEKLNSKDIWQLGQEFVEPKRGEIIARADFKAKWAFSEYNPSINKYQLSIIPEPQPHPRHADIIGWPESKDERKAIANELALTAQPKLLRKNEPLES